MKSILKKVIVFFMFFAIIYICSETLNANGIQKISDLYTNVTALENLNSIIQIICGIFVIIGTFIAVWQYTLSVRDSKDNREREYQLHEKEVFEMEKDRIQRAIDLSGYYKDYLIKDISILRHVYKTTGVIPILNKIDFNKIEHFDNHEINKYILAEDVKKIQSVTKEKKMVDALIVASEVTGLWTECREIITIKEEEKLKKQVTVSADAIIYKFQSMVRDLLNNLEYFSMNFTHGTADESVVYQSLHKIFIETVQVLYYDIAANNTGAEEKVYTNTIELYNIWIKRAREQKDNEVAATREQVSKGNTLKKC